jgi:hypothetical protein
MDKTAVSGGDSVSIQTMRRQLLNYQRLMVEARTIGDMTAYEVYREKTRQLTDEIRKKETACSQQTA